MWEIIYLQVNQPGIDSLLNDPIFLLLVVGMIIGIILIISGRHRENKTTQQQLQIKKPTVKTKLVCPSCKTKGITIDIIRSYKQGDQLFKTTDRECPNCGSKMKIEGIYAEPSKKKHPSKLGCFSLSFLILPCVLIIHDREL